jgi:hypothetical protein
MQPSQKLAEVYAKHTNMLKHIVYTRIYAVWHDSASEAHSRR